MGSGSLAGWYPGISHMLRFCFCSFPASFPLFFDVGEIRHVVSVVWSTRNDTPAGGRLSPAAHPVSLPAVSPPKNVLVNLPLRNKLQKETIQLTHDLTKAPIISPLYQLYPNFWSLYPHSDRYIPIIPIVVAWNKNHGDFADHGRCAESARSWTGTFGGEVSVMGADE